MIMKIWQIDAAIKHSVDEAIAEAAQCIRAGELVAFPTETVYGLGADARNSAAVKRIFEAKGRPSDNPLIVHIADVAQLDGIVDASASWVQQLIAHFWPGPLTLVLPLLSADISSKVTAGLNTLAVRMPDHPLALQLIEASGCLIAAPSANRSGRPSPTKAAHVIEDLQHASIAGVIDGGATGYGLESTVVEVGTNQLRILRHGAITAAALADHLPEHISIIQNTAHKAHTHHDHIPPSPGLKYVHYAPQGQMTLVKGDSLECRQAWIQQQLQAAQERGERTGVLTYEEHAHHYEADVVLVCGSWHRPSDTAKLLYDTLRQFDREGVTYIIAEACDEAGVGFVVNSRLEQAAGFNVVTV